MDFMNFRWAAAGAANDAARIEKMLELILQPETPEGEQSPYSEKLLAFNESMKERLKEIYDMQRAALRFRSRPELAFLGCHIRINSPKLHYNEGTLHVELFDHVHKALEAMERNSWGVKGQQEAITAEIKKRAEELNFDNPAHELDAWLDYFLYMGSDAPVLAEQLPEFAKCVADSIAFYEEIAPGSFYCPTGAEYHDRLHEIIDEVVPGYRTEANTPAL